MKEVIFKCVDVSNLSELHDFLLDDIHVKRYLFDEMGKNIKTYAKKYGDISVLESLGFDPKDTDYDFEVFLHEMKEDDLIFLVSQNETKMHVTTINIFSIEDLLRQILFSQTPNLSSISSKSEIRPEVKSDIWAQLKPFTF